MAGYNSGNPYAVNEYRLPNGNVVALTAQQYQQIFGSQNNAMQPANVQPAQQPIQAMQPTFPAQTVQQSQDVHINGRMVNSHEDIVPNEVPMNGSVSYFPTSDYSCIYAKKWDSNGNIQTAKYILEIPTQGKEVVPTSLPENDILNQVLERLGSIEAKLDKQRPYKKPYNKNQPKPKQNKEG